MILREENFKIVENENMRGGDGVVTIVQFQEAKNMKNCRLMSKIIIPVGASIGQHEHLNETEHYIILEGTGIVVDNGKEEKVSAGDVVETAHGSSHSISNNGNSDLVMIAVIVTY